MNFDAFVDNRPHVRFAARRDDHDLRLAVGGDVEDGTAEEALVAAIDQSHPDGPSPAAAPLANSMHVVTRRGQSGRSREHLALQRRRRGRATRNVDAIALAWTARQIQFDATPTRLLTRPATSGKAGLERRELLRVGRASTC